MTKQPHANNLCGAKTRSGQACKNRAMSNGKCRMHGGKSTGAPKRNQNSKKHGFFSKHIPIETLEIMNGMGEVSAADLIWDQISIQYAAIIRAQQIMFVSDKNEMIKELKKEKEFSSDSGEGTELEYDFQFAWDRQATFMNAQSRAMSELRSLIKQFNELAHDDDERRLKLQGMGIGIDKAKLEIQKFQKELQTETSTEDKLTELIRQNREVLKDG